MPQDYWDPTPGLKRFCPTCGKPQTMTTREDRSPKQQWECDEGHTFPVYGRKDEGEP